MPPNVPRSRRWNHDALTFTIATAPKLWKYMFAANRIVNAITDGWPSLVATTMPMPRLQIAAPPAAMRIVNRPPQTSVSGPLSRNARP